MRRTVLFRLLSLCWLAAGPGIAYGDHRQAWVGSEVLPKFARVQPRVGGRVTSSSVVCVRTVKQVKGDWLSVGDGWLRSDEVVPLEEAAAWFTAQIERRPTAFDYLSRAAARCAQGDHEGAETDCASALRINPRLYSAYYQRAAARAKQGHFEDAIRDYDAALRLNPRLAGAYLDRGAARLKLGDYRGSLKDVNDSLRLAPREPDAFYVRGIARYHLQQYGTALSDLNFALRMNPGRATAYDDRGACQEKLGHADKALADYEKAIDLDPSSASASSHRDRLRIARAVTK
ncbi:MAG: tetratricopeptide repeat protein [Pirellulales bacterium]